MSTIPHGVRLTRVPRWDDRNLNYRVQEAKRLPYNKYHNRYVWLNQGDTPACTGFSGATALAYAPHSIRADNGLSEFAARLYKENQKFDEFPGENYEGSSVLGCAQALSHFGFLVEYHWATTAAEVATALSDGPVILGIDWYTKMFTPDENGRLTVQGNIEGGHAICVGAQQMSGDWFRLDNTWGEDWGIRGSAWMHASDLDMLLSVAHKGEAMVPRKVSKLPAFSTMP